MEFMQKIQITFLHSGIEGFCDRKEPILLTLYTLSRLKEVYGEKEIYILENPSVFSCFANNIQRKVLFAQMDS